MKLLKKIFTKENIILAIIVLAGLWLRNFELTKFYNYDHDGDLLAWIIKDVVTNHHLRLVGQMTSQTGIYIGPLFYYSMIPFFFLSKMDPIGGVWGVTFVFGSLTVLSYYYIFSKLYGVKTGLVAAAVYAISFAAVFNDKRVVPTTPVMLWSVWYYYALNLFLKGEKKAYLITGILFGLVWHLNLALAVGAPLALLAIIFSKKKTDLKFVGYALGLFVVLSIPLILFELKHNFLQTRYLLLSFQPKGVEVIHGWYKIEKILLAFGNNVRFVLMGNMFSVSSRVMYLGFWGVFILATLSKIIRKKMAILLGLWFILYVAFFGKMGMIFSEYYIDGMSVIYFSTFILIVSYLLGKGIFLKVLGVGVLGGFIALNILSVVKYNSNNNGYVYRKGLVDYIFEDAKAHGYPCAAISYVTNPGYNLGYRYLFYIKDMKLADPKSGAPVYSIVFPLSIVDRIDKVFGGLGVILPDYKKYNMEKVNKVCQGENFNLSQPMPGYTQ